MKRTDFFDVKCARFLQELLNLNAVLSDNAEIVASCLASPVLINVERAELSETVGGEKHLVVRIISNHNLRPMNHGGSYEIERMLTKLKR